MRRSFRSASEGFAGRQERPRLEGANVARGGWDEREEVRDAGRQHRTRRIECEAEGPCATNAYIVASAAHAPTEVSATRPCLVARRRLPRPADELDDQRLRPHGDTVGNRRRTGPSSRARHAPEKAMRKKIASATEEEERGDEDQLPHARIDVNEDRRENDKGEHRQAIEDALDDYRRQRRAAADFLALTEDIRPHQFTCAQGQDVVRHVTDHDHRPETAHRNLLRRAQQDMPAEGANHDAEEVHRESPGSASYSDASRSASRARRNPAPAARDRGRRALIAMPSQNFSDKAPERRGAPSRCRFASTVDVGGGCVPGDGHVRLTFTTVFVSSLTTIGACAVRVTVRTRRACEDRRGRP